MCHITVQRRGEEGGGDEMTLAAIQKEIEQWDSEQQDRLAACLSVLRLKRNPEHAKELSRGR
jgi:hypothetical protein